MKYSVYKLEAKSFNKKTFKEFKTLAESKQLKSFCYNRYNYLRVDDRVSKKRIFGWWDEIIPELFEEMTFALSLHDISSMYHYRFESNIWPFRINKYEVEQVVIFEIRKPEDKGVVEVEGNFEMHERGIIFELDYLRDNLPEDIRDEEWVRVEKELKDRDITLTAIYKPSHSCYFIND